MPRLKIKYEKYSFVPPRRISSSQYTQYKQVFKTNPNFNFGLEDESFFGHWSWVWVSIGIVIGVSFIASIIKEELGGICIILGGLFSLFALIQFLLEAPSFALYLKEKRSYFKKMRQAILISTDYDHFCKLFSQF